MLLKFIRSSVYVLPITIVMAIHPMDSVDARAKIPQIGKTKNSPARIGKPDPSSPDVLFLSLENKISLIAIAIQIY